MKTRMDAVETAPPEQRDVRRAGPDVYAEALDRCRTLLERAQRCGLPEPTAMTLATVDEHGRPSARTVLLKEVAERGFVFYTSLASRKARQLAANPQAALCFFWQPLMEQVLVEGVVEQVSDEAADAYWTSRPRAHQLGAWASRQSSRLDCPRTLDLRWVEQALRFIGQRVPRPSYWTGFRVVPHRIEFWRRRAARLHERVLYERHEAQWTKAWLYP
jgi:pyridoxamine 5'-phosphate oxidase